MSTTGEKYNEKELTNLLEGLRVPTIITKEQTWANFEAHLNQKHKVATKRSLNSLVYAIAAGIALFIGIPSWFFHTGDTKIWCPHKNLILFLTLVEYIDNVSINLITLF